MPAGFAYYLVYPEASADAPRVVAFTQWIRAEAAAMEAEPVGGGT